jgi:hypothetical protein
MRSSLLKSVIITKLQATEAYPSLDLTKVKYSISSLSVVENKNIIIRISPSNFIACVKRKNQYDDENEVHSQYLHTDPEYNLFAI